MPISLKVAMGAAERLLARYTTPQIVRITYTNDKGYMPKRKVVDGVDVIDWVICLRGCKAPKSRKKLVLPKAYARV